MLIILGKANILNLMRESSRYQFWIKASRRWWEFDIQGLSLIHIFVGVDIDYEVLGQGGNMLMVTASGTAVVIE